MSIELEIYNKRMIELIDILKNTGVIRFKIDFLKELNLDPAYVHRIGQGENSFTPEHIKKACDIYRVNANWIFGYSNDVFID